MGKIVTQKQVATSIVDTLQKQGYIALFAGGCVRDELLNRAPKDYDVATDAYPDEVEKLFPKTVPIGKAFGVIAVIQDGHTVEVATFREEVGTLDGRHPETIMFSAAKEDAIRRDFTINGMFFDPIKNQLHDYVHGQRDIKKNVVVAIGDPAERFREDHLRMLRAVRFAHTLQFNLDPETDAAIKKMAPLIERISAERIEAELTRTLTESEKAGDALKHLHELGLLTFILPEIIPTIGQKQPPQFHPEGDVFEHTCLMLNLMDVQKNTADDFNPRELAYSILLHDVAKPETATVERDQNGTERIRFNGHAAHGAEMAEKILTRLKFPNIEKKRIISTISGHMRFLDVQQMRTSTLRKMIGTDTFELGMELHRIDSLGSNGELDHYNFIRAFQEKTAHEPVLPEPYLNGADLIKLGIHEGKRIGTLLNEIYDLQMEAHFNSREEALSWVKENRL